MMSQSSKPQLLVVGSLNYDLVFLHDRLPGPGESVVGATFYESPGGKGANQAVAAARSAQGRFELGVAFCGAIGADEFGRRQLAVLEGEGIDTEGLVVLDGVASGTSAVWVEEQSGENRVLSAPGANSQFLPNILREAAFDTADLVLMPNEIPAETLQVSAELAAAKSVPLIWNPAPYPAGASPPFDLALASLLTPNEVEAGGLLGEAWPGSSSSVAPQAAAAAARSLAERYECDLVVTLGSQGALAVFSDGPALHQPAPEVAVVDTTGAGDAFNGSLAAARLSGASWPEALAFAVSYASASVGAAGTQTALPGAGVDLPLAPAVRELSA